MCYIYNLFYFSSERRNRKPITKTSIREIQKRKVDTDGTVVDKKGELTLNIPIKNKLSLSGIKTTKNNIKKWKVDTDGSAVDKKGKLTPNIPIKNKQPLSGSRTTKNDIKKKR